LNGKFFAFQPRDSNITQLVLYWYESAVFNTGSSSEQKYVKISLITYPENSEDIPETENMLLSFGKTIANYWQPIRTWSTIALTIAQNGHLLITIPTAFIVAILIVQIIQKQREKKSNLKIYNKLPSEKDKLILKTVHQTAKKNQPTANSIALHYQKLSGKKTELDLLIKKLKEAEKVNLIKRDITSREDEPTLTWKSQIPF